jgi:ribosome maturation factor RimP
VCIPAGGERSGLIAHFLFAENFRPANAELAIEPGSRPPDKEVAQKKMAVRLDAIRSAAERVAASHGLDVVDMEFLGGAKERILRIFLEKNAQERARLKAAFANGAGELPGKTVEGLQEGGGCAGRGRVDVDQLAGVTHEDCAAFSRDFGVLLDVEDLIPGSAYTLEASSPGLDRKLSKPEDFARFVGCLVKVQTFEPVRNNRHWQGRLLAADSQVSKSRTGAPAIVLDLAAVKQNSKSRKAGVSTVEIALGNIEKANLVPEI